MIRVPMRPQPDDFTCGPTSLQAVYGFFGEELDLSAIVDGVHFLEDGGTLGVHLGLDALRRGYEARLHSFNFQVFDPSWAGYGPEELDAALAARARVKTDPKLLGSIDAYRSFLRQGGIVDLTDLSPALLHRYFDRGLPVLAGLSATYLYATPRERTEHQDGVASRVVSDDIGGDPQGHFVVLCGFDGDRVVVADPYGDNPIAEDHYYDVEVQRLVNAIMLGVLTYDGNLLVVSRRNGGPGSRDQADTAGPGRGPDADDDAPGNEARP